MNTIAVFSGIVFLCIALFNWFLPYVTQKSIRFGVRIPREREDDPSIAQTRRNFHFRLLSGLSFIFATSFLLPSILGYFTLSVLSVMFESLYTHLNYYVAFRDLHRIKKEQKWYEGVSENIGVVYQSEPLLRKAISGSFFIFPSVLLLCLISYTGISGYSNFAEMLPLRHTLSGAPVDFVHKSLTTVFSLTLRQAIITVVIFIMGYIISRTRQEIDPSRPYTTYEQQTRFKMYYRDMLYAYSTFWGISLSLASLNMWEYPGLTIPVTLEIIPVIFGSALLVAGPFLMGQMGSRISVIGEETEFTGSSREDDDRNWRAGIIYINRKDPSILVARRFGIGWTLNLGNPVSWILVALFVSIIVFIVFHFVLKV